MIYIFLLGRNIELSKIEIHSFLKKDGIKINSSSLRSNGLLIDIDKEIDMKSLINKLGGAIAIGKVLFQGKLEEILKEIQENEIYFGTQNKFTYSIINLIDGFSFDRIYNQIKKKFKEEKLKARYQLIRGLIKTQEGRIILGSPSKIYRLDEKYFVFKDKDNYFFGVLKGIYDAKESEEKDMKKPIRRESLSISPRLAKILINLSQVKEGEILLDPFCGIGVILQEALLQNIEVFGADIDPIAVKNCKLNISWLEKKYNLTSKYTLINTDSAKLKIGRIDGIATEPFLGKLLKRVPDKKEAEKMIREFENLMSLVLNNLKKYVKKQGKIVFTSPLIKVKDSRQGINVKRITDSTNLKVYSSEDIGFPIEEFRGGQIVGREIFVLNVE